MDEQGKAKELTLDAAREALELYVRSKTWLRRDLAKKLAVESFERSGSFHVVMRSFTESRAIAPAFVPYRGEFVDGPDRGRAPAAWDIAVEVPGTFINQDHFEPVPHTDEVRTCHGCGGAGQITCPGCGGDGRVRCSSCGGDGRVTRTRSLTRTNSQGQTEHYTETYTESCGTCGGDGQVTCSSCSGSGRVTCPTCQGATRLKHYRRLCVTWKTHTTDEVIEKTDLPDDLVTGAVGIAILVEEEDRIEPSEGSGAGGGGPYRDGGGRVSPEVNEVANKLIRGHTFPGDVKLHRQALHVRAVPVYEARYPWGKEKRRFWVYGTDEQVYAPRYPLSIVRIGLAAGIPSAVIGAGIAGVALSAPPPPPPRPAATMTAPPPPAPPPIPTPEPTPVKLAPAPSATGKKPLAPPGKAVVEIRTEPPGADIVLGTRKVGKSPLFAVVGGKLAGTCSGGCKAGAYCAGGKTCEAETAGVAVAPGGERIEFLVHPTEEPVVELRFKP